MTAIGQPAPAIDISRAAQIKGWMHPLELAFLAGQAQQSQLVIECGSWKGRSTRALADHCPGVVYAIDPWGGDYLTEGGKVHSIKTSVYPDFAENLQDHLEAARVVPVRSKFRDAVEFLREALPPADFVFIDGDHRYTECRDDIRDALSLMPAGGILAGHDYGHEDWPGVKRAVDEAFGPRVNLVKTIWWVRVCAS